jgi:sugar lactone lactonase YvrE
MKNLSIASYIKSLLFLVGILVSISSCKDDEPDTGVTPEEPISFQASAFVKDLHAPVGGVVDDKGRLWVTEAGTGNDDAAVIMITADGNKTVYVAGLPSELANGAIEGIGHPFFKDGKLYFLQGTTSGHLYIADVASFASGAAAVDLSTIPKEDIATYVLSQDLVDPANSNTYSMTWGHDDNLYIVDSGSNAIIKRKTSDKTLSVFARIPEPATGIDAVPTDIVYDGEKYIVSSLSGFPFTEKNAKVYQVSKDGVVSDYKTGFTLLTSVALTVGNKPIFTQLAVFGATGFGPKTGKVVNLEGQTLLDELTMPTSIIRYGDKNYYLISYGEGTVTKLSY